MSVCSSLLNILALSGAIRVALSWFHPTWNKIFWQWLGQFLGYFLLALLGILGLCLHTNHQCRISWLETHRLEYHAGEEKGQRAIAVQEEGGSLGMMEYN